MSWAGVLKSKAAICHAGVPNGAVIPGCSTSSPGPWPWTAAGDGLIAWVSIPLWETKKKLLAPGY